MAERDLRGQARESRALGQPEPEMPEVLIDHHNLLALKSQLDRPTHERVLAVGGLHVALNLRLGGLAQIHERLPAQMRRAQLLALTHRAPPAPRRRDCAINAANIAIAATRCSSPSSSHNATAGAGLSARSRRNCTLCLLAARLEAIILPGQDATPEHPIEHPPRRKQAPERPERPR